VLKNANSPDVGPQHINCLLVCKLMRKSVALSDTLLDRRWIGTKQFWARILSKEKTKTIILLRRQGWPRCDIWHNFLKTGWLLKKVWF